MTQTKEQLDAKIADVDQKISDLNEKMKPIERGLNRLYKNRNALLDARADLNRDDFVALLKDESAHKQMRAYLKKFQGAASEYEGVRNEGFYHDKKYAGVEWAFSLYLSKPADVDKAEKFISAHIHHLTLLDSGWDRPYTHFGFCSDASGLDYLAWDGTDWYILRFVYGHVRDHKKMPSLRAALERALEKSKRSRDEGDDDE